MTMTELERQLRNAMRARVRDSKKIQELAELLHSKRQEKKDENNSTART